VVREINSVDSHRSWSAQLSAVRLSHDLNAKVDSSDVGKVVMVMPHI
jgi:hypothetical protein